MAIMSDPTRKNLPDVTTSIRALGENSARKRYGVQSLGPGNLGVNKKQVANTTGGPLQGIIVNAPQAGQLAGAMWIDEDTSGHNVHCGEVWVIADAANTQFVVVEWE